ncbi:MAG: cysteine-rich CWC family protein [Bacteroidetes bacterium]|nr:cysteine-rich CWC family protein [Bacteroidota bacterium]
MCEHEKKVCQRCKAHFECKVGSIQLCQCSTIVLSEEERNFIQHQFDDCLCIDCIKALKAEYHQSLFSERIKNSLNR